MILRFYILTKISFYLFQQSPYYVRIARFMPRVEIVHKHNTAARRLYIRGHNGKVGLLSDTRTVVPTVPKLMYGGCGWLCW